MQAALRWAQTFPLTAQAMHKAGPVHCIAEQREELHADPLLLVGPPSQVQTRDKALLHRCSLMQSNAQQEDKGHLLAACEGHCQSPCDPEVAAQHPTTTLSLHTAALPKVRHYPAAARLQSLHQQSIDASRRSLA